MLKGEKKAKLFLAKNRNSSDSAMALTIKLLTVTLTNCYMTLFDLNKHDMIFT